MTHYEMEKFYQNMDIYFRFHLSLMEGLLDQKRVIYLPYSEDKNLVMELPNAPGLLFISQLISSGGEIIFALDKVVHKYWVIAIHQVYTPPKVKENFNFL